MLLKVQSRSERTENNEAELVALQTEREWPRRCTPYYKQMASSDQ